MPFDYVTELQMNPNLPELDLLMDNFADPTPL